METKRDGATPTVETSDQKQPLACHHAGVPPPGENISKVLEIDMNIQGALQGVFFLTGPPLKS